MLPDDRDLLLGIEAGVARAAAAGRESVRIGPFLATFHPTSDMIWLNHVVPSGGENRHADADQIAELRAHFHRRQRILRFEFIEALWPDLAGILEQSGLALQARFPFMICVPATFAPAAAPAAEVRSLQAADGDAELAAFVRVGKQAFGDVEATTEPHEIADARRGLAAGHTRCALARIGETVVGVGTLLNLSGELAGIGTLPGFRRRGVAAAVCSHLLDEHFRAGGELSWLSAGNDTASGVYQRVGFRQAGTQLNYMDRPQQ